MITRGCDGLLNPQASEICIMLTSCIESCVRESKHELVDVQHIHGKIKPADLITKEF